MRATRRTVLRAAGAGLAAGLAPFPGRTARAAAARTAGTTLAGTVRRGPAGAGGYTTLVSGPGEPHRVRDGLGVRPGAGRETRRRPLLAFAHLTDVHVVDAQSPGRDGPVELLFSSAYRPPEVLSLQTADSLVSAVERVGHGFTAAIVAEGTAHYACDAAPGVRGLVLEPVNPNGEAGGSLDPDQLAWLRAQLQRATAQRRLVVVFSHHTSTTMDNALVAAGGDLRLRVTGDEVLALLLAFRACVLWVCGHTHENRVTAHRRAGGGLWEVSTAAHIDWPSQARLLELLDNRDGTLSVVTTMLDADAPLSDGRRTGSTRAPASLARELAANDPQERTDARLGDLADRNVELLVPHPFAVSSPPAPASPEPRVPVPTAPTPATGDGPLPATGLDDLAALTAAGLIGAAGLSALAARRREP